MVAFITTAGLGTLICVLGVINMTGNISSIHSYHRQRVREEDKKPFGRLVGLGTLIIGAALVAFGALFFAFERSGLELFVLIGTATLIFGLGVGMTFAFYAMKKYNGGIF